MCGLFGLITSAPMYHDDRTLFSQGMLVTQLRGMDSTGIIRLENVIPPEKVVCKYFLDKELGPASDYILNDVKQNLMKPVGNHQIRALLGHCRHATKGKVTKDNAHPFDTEHIVGMHNGTVHTSFTKELKQVGLDKDFDTDSEELINFIGHHDLQEFINKVGEHGGAYALVLFDKRVPAVRILKNEKRPLYFAQNHAGDIAYCSEKEMLALVLKRNEFRIKDDIVSLPDFHELTIPIGRGTTPKDFEVKELKRPKTRVVVPAISARPLHQGYVGRGEGYSGYAESYWPYSEDTFGLTYHQVTHFENEDYVFLGPKDVIKKGKLKKRYKNQFFMEGINARLASKLMYMGCRWCGEQKSLEDFSKVKWIEKHTYLCGDCDGENFCFYRSPEQTADEPKEK